MTFFIHCCYSPCCLPFLILLRSDISPLSFPLVYLFLPFSFFFLFCTAHLHTCLCIFACLSSVLRQWRREEHTTYWAYIRKERAWNVKRRNGMAMIIQYFHQRALRRDEKNTWQQTSCCEKAFLAFRLVAISTGEQHRSSVHTLAQKNTAIFATQAKRCCAGLRQLENGAEEGIKHRRWQPNVEWSFRGGDGRTPPANCRFNGNNMGKASSTLYLLFISEKKEKATEEKLRAHLRQTRHLKASRHLSYCKKLFAHEKLVAL